MHRTIVTFSLLIALLLPAGMFAQVKNVYGGTGKVRFRVNRAGSVALFDADFTTQVQRLSLVIGLDSAHVFDYEEDANYLTKSAFISIGGSTDSIGTALFDNSWKTPIPPPDVRVLANAYATKQDSFVVVGFKATSTAATDQQLYIGVGCVAEPSETYGGETIEYDATGKFAFFYRLGEAPYIGIKLLGADPASFHALDWDTYSPTDTENDAATDATRWAMTAKPGFDAPTTAGVNGSFFNLNYPVATLTPNSPVTYWVAMLRSTSLAGLRKLADSAAQRYATLQSAAAVKNVYGGTGKVRFRLNRAGSFALFDKDFMTQLQRSSLVVAQDSAHVYDYEEDGQYIMSSAALSTGGAADTVADVLFDNSYIQPPLDPQIRGWAEAHAWKGDPFVLVDWTITNYGKTSKQLYVGLGGVPEPSETYGGETVAYDAVKKMAYFFRSGELPHVGIKVIGVDPISFHGLDWDVYSPTDTENDAAVDSTRWSMTAKPGFDAPVTGGVNGSFFNLNIANPTIDAGASVTYTVAYLYADSLPALRAVADAAVARFANPTAVEQIGTQIPEKFSLKQNYPNPFNPSTTIRCQIPAAAHVKLAVYDVLGREVAVLANDNFTPGEYAFRFDGGRFASGVYFCRLVAGTFTATTKMILQK
jgi:hypothetical protein